MGLEALKRYSFIVWELSYKCVCYLCVFAPTLTCSMTTAPGSPDYVLQIDMWAYTNGWVENEYARAKYNTFKVKGDYYELEVERQYSITRGQRQIAIHSSHVQVGDYVEDPNVTPAGDMLSRYNGVEFSTYDQKRSNHAHCTNKGYQSGGW